MLKSLMKSRMQSSIYEGSVRHVRRMEPRHGFTKRLFMLYLDLSELGAVVADVSNTPWNERFFQTWKFYLAYCEGAFHERVNLAAQLVFENGGGRRNSILGALEILEEQFA